VVIKWANYRVWQRFTTEFSVISLPSLAAFYYRVWQILVYAFDKIAEFKPSFYLNFSNYKQAVNPILQRFCGIENSWYFCYRNGHYGNDRYDKS
jgi:hypothetical protein